MSSPIIIVTGANTGVGFGTCQRLLVQLSSRHPSDSLAQEFEEPTQDNSATPEQYTGLTLIMACRSVNKAQKAREELLQFFSAHVQELKSLPGYDGHAEVFQKNLSVDVEYLDLASIKTVLEFSKRINDKYPHISHLICNAGLASFTGLDWPILLQQIFTQPMTAVTAPTYYLQNQGELSIDGLGWVWQCNVFGHFILCRQLEQLLSRSPLPGGSRVIWCSSLEASPKFYKSSDWQLRLTDHSYESSKYQIDLIATTLDRQSLATKTPIRYFITQPGVTSTNVANALVGPLLDIIKVWLFYLARWFGSPHHPVLPYKAAVASVHLALVPLAFLAIFSDSRSPPVRFGAETDRRGNERVGITPVRAWLANQDEGVALVEKCDALLVKLKEEEARPPQFETATEKM